jgi:FkbM family methyltransferase
MRPDAGAFAMNVLVRLCHGLGDVIQLTVVLQHLRRYRPEWTIDVQTLRGKHTAVKGLCRNVYHDQEPGPRKRNYQSLFDLPWYECYSVYSDSPSTKACNCLREIFGLKPDLELCRYSIQIAEEDRFVTADYLKSVGSKRLASGRFNSVVLHYQGNTSPEKKNLDHLTASAACLEAIDCGFVPIVLDWDRRSPLPDQAIIFCPRTGAGDIWGEFGSGDAARITALIQQSSLFVGIDSGPAKAAAATTTPSICVWTGHHPIQFHDMSDTLHLVPEDHRQIPPSQNQIAADFFERHYRFQTYGREALAATLCQAIRSTLIGKQEKDPSADIAKIAGFWCHTDRIDQDLTIIDDVCRADCYHVRDLADFPVRTIVDVGAHIGTFARRANKTWPGAKIVCLEVAPENIEALHRNVGDFGEFAHACVTAPKAGELALLNAFTTLDKARSTGGSAVAAAAAVPPSSDPQYRYEPLSCDQVTLDQVLANNGWPFLDLLKVDCEGSEYAILETTDINRIGIIIGEYHERERWEQFRRKRFPGWRYRLLSETGECGNFHLFNPLATSPEE